MPLFTPYIQFTLEDFKINLTLAFWWYNFTIYNYNHEKVSSCINIRIDIHVLNGSGESKIRNRADYNY